MTRLTLLDGDWPSHVALLSTIEAVASTGQWEEVGIVASDQRILWIETDFGVDLFYTPDHSRAARSVE